MCYRVGATLPTDLLPRFRSAHPALEAADGKQSGNGTVTITIVVVVIITVSTIAATGYDITAGVVAAGRRAAVQVIAPPCRARGVIVQHVLQELGRRARLLSEGTAGKLETIYHASIQHGHRRHKTKSVSNIVW